MNLREGRIGAQEAIAAAAIAVSVSGIFVTDNNMLYGQGNAAYICAAFSAGLALLLFLYACRGMERTKSATLHGLFCYAAGPVFAWMLSLLLFCVLVLSSADGLSRFVLMLNRFAFPAASHWQILYYLAPVTLLMSYFGLESLGRTARLLCWVFLLSLVIALLMAIPSYETYRLFPIPGAPPGAIITLSLTGISRFLPGLLALLIVARGVHGPKNARRTGVIAGAIGGGLSAASQVCLGMTYSYKDLREMHSPLYRLTMRIRSGGSFPRLDQLLLFGWTIAGIMASAFYQYAAALLWCEMFDVHDVRPAVLGTGGITFGLCLLSHMNLVWFQQMQDFLYRWGFLLIALPVVIGTYCAIRKSAKKKEAST